MAPQGFDPVIVTTGTVNFNGDKSTAVIPAISGPVSRTLVEPGDAVQPGQPLALVASPDFAADVAGIARRRPPGGTRNASRHWMKSSSRAMRCRAPSWTSRGATSRRPMLIARRPCSS